MNGEVSISVTTSVSVPDETARRCMTLLEMWLDDNPNKNIVCDAIPTLLPTVLLNEMLNEIPAEEGE